MIDVKEAVKNAILYFEELYQGDYSNLALEEVEFSDDEKHWFITLGFTPPTTGIAQMAGTVQKREYKSLTINSESGSIISMKIRTVR